MTRSDDTSNDSTNQSLDRRTFLATTGAGFATALTLPTTARAGRDADDIFERGMELKRQTNSRDVWKKFLKNRGWSFTTSRHVYDVPHGDGVTTSNYEESEDLDTEFFLGFDCSNPDEYYAEVSWSYSTDFGDYGDMPMDYAGISFEHDEWEFLGDTINETFSTSGSYVNYHSLDTDGAAAEVDDNEITADGKQSDLFWFGANITPEGSSDSSERQVRGGYAHTWSDITVESVSVGLPYSVSLTVSNETYYWNTNTKKDENTYLLAYQDEANGC